MANSVNSALQGFGRLFVKVETIIVILIATIIIGIGLYASSKRDPRTGERNMYGYMFVGVGIAFIVLFLLYANWVGSSAKAARLAGLGALMRAV
jgi:hypothetical protein